MNKILIVCILVLFVTSCQSTQDKMIEHQIEAESGKDVEVNSATGSMVIESEDETITIKEGDKYSWCQQGSEWNMQSDQAQANMVVEGIVSAGKYAGYCHVVYDMTSENSVANMDFYFDEDGNGYQVMEVNGQKYEQSWTK